MSTVCDLGADTGHLFLYCASRGREGDGRGNSWPLPKWNTCKCHGKGKNVRALLAVKIPLENRRTKAAQPGIFEKKQKNYLKVTAEGKNGATWGWLGKGRKPLTEEAETEGPSKPSMWWSDTKCHMQKQLSLAENIVLVSKLLYSSCEVRSWYPSLDHGSLAKHLRWMSWEK